MDDRDLRWLWAAYRLGGMPDAPPGLTETNLWPTLIRTIEGVRPGVKGTALMANIPGKGRVPVGWLLAWPRSLNLPKVVEMHAIWAPWASARNRLEACVSSGRLPRLYCGVA